MCEEKVYREMRPIEKRDILIDRIHKDVMELMGMKNKCDSHIEGIKMSMSRSVLMLNADFNGTEARVQKKPGNRAKLEVVLVWKLDPKKEPELGTDEFSMDAI